MFAEPLHPNKVVQPPTVAWCVPTRPRLWGFICSANDAQRTQIT
jgi:hypothetical protein